MKTFLTLFAVAVALCMVSAVQAAPPAAGGAAAQTLPGNNPAADNNDQMNSPAGSNTLPQTNTPGTNPASSTQDVNSNPPGSNAPLRGSYQNPPQGNRALGNQGATINTPRGQVDIGRNASGGLGVDVNRSGATNPTANAQAREELRDDRQNDRQNLRDDRQNFRQDMRQDLRADRQENRQERLNDPNRWRYTYQNGDWWYWLPSNSWVYWRENQWMPYNAEAYRPFGYRTGYRGTDESPRFYTDESGRQYRRDYSPFQPKNPEMQTDAPSGAMQSGSQESNMNESPRMNENTKQQ